MAMEPGVVFHPDHSFPRRVNPELGWGRTLRVSFEPASYLKPYIISSMPSEGVP
jgi:hypothetical protein